MKGRVLGGALSVTASTVGGALVLADRPWLGACLGLAVGVFVMVALVVSPKPSARERAFMAEHGWESSQTPDAIAVEALAGRSFAGRGRSVIEGEWRGRRAARFLVQLEEGVNVKEVWIEGVFVDGCMPMVDLVARGNRHRRLRDDALVFNRAWRVYSTDRDFAEALLHDQMRSRFVSAPRPRRAVYFGGGFVGVKYEAASPNLKETPERLDFVSDLADLIPRAAWDVLIDRTRGIGVAHMEPVGRHEYAGSHIGLPSSSPVKVSAPSAGAASFKRVLVAVAAVLALSVATLWLIT